MLSGIANIASGSPAIKVFQLCRDQKVAAKSAAETAADEVVLTAVKNPPRVGETRSIGALLPDVLARYGLERPFVHQGTTDESLAGVDMHV